MSTAPGALLPTTGWDVEFASGSAAVATRRSQGCLSKGVMAERDALVGDAADRADSLVLSAGENVGPGVVARSIVMVSGRYVVFHA